MSNVMNSSNTFSSFVNSQVGKSHTASLSDISDHELYSLCRKYGFQTRAWRDKFIGLLPEVKKRELYLKKGFPSIFVFAKILAGISEEQVRRAVNIEEKLEKCGLNELKTLLTSGEVSVNKLARVVSVATSENEKILAEQVKILSKGAVETLVRDIKWEQKNEGKTYVGDKNDCSTYGNPSETQNSLFEPRNGIKSVPGHRCILQDSDMSNATFSALGLSREVVEKLQKLKRKNIDVNVLLLEFLEEREKGIKETKREITQKQLEKVKATAAKAEEETMANETQAKAVTGMPAKPKTKSNGGVARHGEATRHIPAEVKRIIKQEHGDKCSMPDCEKNADHLHHKVPFALIKNHLPNLIAPLCRHHHEIAHAMDVREVEVRRNSR